MLILGSQEGDLRKEREGDMVLDSVWRHHWYRLRGMHCNSKMASVLLKEIEKAWILWCGNELKWEGKGVLVNSGPFVCVCCFSWASRIPRCRGGLMLEGYPSGRPRFPLPLLTEAAAATAAARVRSWHLHGRILEEPSLSLHLFSCRLRRQEGLRYWNSFNARNNCHSENWAHITAIPLESHFFKTLYWNIVLLIMLC